MTENIQSSTSDNGKTIGSNRSISILSMLLMCFSLLSIVPLFLLMIISYPNIKNGFESSVKSELIESSLISKKSIEKWFNELVDSVEFEANTETTKKNITQLNQEFLLTNGDLGEFVVSKNWRNFTEKYYDYYMHFSSMNSDFYDIFIISVKGDILYTLANESDLGTNLNDGIYKNTLFASTFRNVIEGGGLRFSDLEYYAPSLNTISGFIISPIKDENGEILGVFALQINFETAIDLFYQSHHESLVAYLVNDDLFLRSEKKGVEFEELLTTNIVNNSTLMWQSNTGGESDVFSYVDSNNKLVMGIFHTINLIGKKWGVFYEVDESDAYSEINKLNESLVVIFVSCLFLIIIVSYIVAMKISKPIKNISILTKNIRFAEVGSLNAHQGFKEIKILANNFNNMIIQQKEYEKELTKSKQAVISSLNELKNMKYAMDQHSIISITDTKGRILEVNTKFEEISGFSKDELIGNNHNMINSNFHDKEFWKQLYKCIGMGGTWHGEVRNKSKAGEFYWMQSTIVPIKDHDSKINRYISIRTDITERKEFELELFKTKELAEAAVIAKSEFLASMSHEIRTPMNGVLGMLNILQKSKLDDNQSHKVDLAKSSATSLLTIIDDILDFSKIEAGKLDIEYVDFDLLTILSEVVESSYMASQSKNIEIILDYSLVLQNKYVGDPGRIKQILFNLIGNSIKFTDAGSVNVIAEVQDLNDEEFKFICKIKDTGIGIHQTKLNTLFDKFTQADNSTTREYGGTGLGLAIVRQLSVLMGGGVTVKSEEGVGSEFGFHIILKGKRNNDFDHDIVNKYGHIKMLIVIKNKNERVNASKQFSRFCKQVDCVESLSESKKLINKTIYNLILIDEQFLNGHDDYLNFYKQYEKKGSILVVVKNESNKNIGYCHSFQKPIDFRDVIYCLESTNKPKHCQLVANEVLVHEFNETTRNILLVEDNFVNQQVALSLLEELNCTVDLAENGVQALDKLKDKSNRYDLIFMDCQMPVMDGYTATRQIRIGNAGQHNTNAVIIALTANAMKGDMEKCLESGMDDYLSKPIETDVLSKMLKKYLASQ